MIDKPNASHLILPLKRPEYFSVPEVLVSALAWRAFMLREGASPPGVGVDATNVPDSVGYMYETQPRSTKKLELRATRPKDDRASSLGALLKSRGNISTGVDDALLGEAVASSVLGIRVENSRLGSQPASPMSPALALMQDPRGVLVKQGPPDYGEIIEAMYALGNATLGEKTATRCWYDAAQHRLRIDPFLRSIDDALMTSALGGSVVRRDEETKSLLGDEWSGLYRDTPFNWFASSWRALTREDWVEALPARVWVDWATTVLRLAIGLGFLWEAAWYERLGEAMLHKGRMPATFGELVQDVGSALPWKSSTDTVSVRDVGSQIKQRIYRGDGIRNFLSKSLGDYERDSGLMRNRIDAIAFLKTMADTQSENLRAVLNEKRDGARLIWETVKYGLQVRESSGPFTDYYGILKTRGRRWLVIEPGTEWIAVVASLACQVPGGQCNVGKVLNDLTRMGMRPPLGDLVSLLEKAGMARGSADADQAVIVESAY